MRRLGLCLAIGILSVCGARAEDCGQAFEILWQPPEQWIDLEPRHFQVHLVNEGDRVWPADGGVYLASHWLHDDGRMLHFEGRRQAIDRAVAPGESIDTELIVDPPPIGRGDLLLVVDMVEDGLCWFSQSDPSPEPGVAVEFGPARAVELISAISPLFAITGREAVIELKVRNEGMVAWTPQRTLVASHWVDPQGERVIVEGRRNPLPGVVEPGETVALSLLVDVPLDLGDLRVEIDLVEEGVAWFSQVDPTQDMPPVRVRAIPNALFRAFFPSLLALALIVAIARGGATPFASRMRWLVGADLIWLLASGIAKDGWALAIDGRPAQPGALAISSLALLGLAITITLVGSRWRAWVALASGTVLSVFALGDGWYLRFFGDVGSLQALGAAGQLDEVADSLAEILRLSDFWLLADLAPAAVLAAMLSRRLESSPARLPALIPLLLLSFPGLSAAKRVADAKLGLVDQTFQRIAVVEHIGLFAYHAMDLVQTATMALESAPDEGERAEIAALLRNRTPLRVAQGELAGSAKGMNLVMLQLEALQAGVLDLEVDGEAVMPFLHAQRSRMISFDRIWDQAAQGRSSDADLLVGASLLPLPQGAAAFRAAGNDFAGFGELLQGAGYSTFVSSPFDGAFWNRRQMMAAYGFERQAWIEDFEAGPHIGWGLEDRSFIAQIEPKLEALPEPFAAWLLPLSLHHPYSDFPAELAELGLESEGAWGNYLEAMRHLDLALADFAAWLTTSGYGERTVVAIYGDHVASFGWTEIMARRWGIDWEAGPWMISERVPLLLWLPGAQSGAIDTPGGLMDLAPTLGALLGLDTEAQPWIGRNLLGKPGNEEIPIRGGSWMGRELGYLDKGPRLGDGRCIDLGTTLEIEPEPCAGGELRSDLLVRASGLILRHDLQTRLLP